MPTPNRSTPLRPQVEVEPFDLVAEDGAVLGATLFRPARPASGAVLVHGATATPQRYYAPFAAFAADALGANVITYDYRGVGRSRPRSLRGFRATLHDWAVLDARAAHAEVRARFAGEPVAVIGHSFGGQLVGLIDDVQDDAAAVVMVGSQLAYYRNWPGLTRLRLWLTWRALVPLLTALYDYLPARFGLGEDLPRGAAEQWARWCLEPEYLAHEYPHAKARFARFDRPTLLYSFTDDVFAPRRAVGQLVSSLNAVRLHHAWVAPREHGGAPIGHFGFFRRRFEPTLWREAVAFLRAGFDGRTPRHVAVPAREPDLRVEVMADLRYGRT